MKVRIDFVTNSSSESFGVVVVDTIATIGATGAALVLIESAKQALVGDSTKIAQEIADAVAQDALNQTQNALDAYSEAEKIINGELGSLQGEMAELSKQWEESDKTADKSDPGYDNLKQQYEEYMNYLKNQIQTKEYEKYMVEVEKAEQQAAVESKNEWINQRQTDMIAVKEEMALLSATAKGYGSKGYDTKDIEDRIKQLQQREKELAGVLKENNAEFDYTPKDRGVIGPGAEFDKLNKEYAKNKVAMEKAMKLADENRRKEIMANMAAAEAEFQKHMASAGRWDLATKAAEGIQFGADIAVEGLSHVTGPAGKSIKLAYTAGKSVASGVGEGMADPKNAGKHLAKGIAGAVTEVVKDSLDGSPFKKAAANVANSAFQGGMDSMIKGKDFASGAKSGALDGVVDSVLEAGIDKLANKLPIQKGTTVDVGDFSVGQIVNNNPLAKGVMKIGARETAMNQLKGDLKDGIKGQIIGGNE
jgi:Zn-finger nucleic acid-binding protein